MPRIRFVPLSVVWMTLVIVVLVWIMVENRLRVEMRSGRLRTVVTVELLDVVAVDVLMELVADDEGGAGADVAEESRGEWTGC
jgi:hypothetical protein